MQWQVTDMKLSDFEAYRILILKTFIDIQIRIDIRNIRIDIRKCQSGENFGVLLTDQIYLDIHSGKDGKIWEKCREKDE